MTVSADLDRRFRTAAAERGPLDVRYVLTDSPLGTLLVAASERGVCRITFDPEPDREVERLARTFGVRVLRTPGGLDDARSQLDQYFAGRRTRFELPLDVGPLADFHQTVLGELAQVPYGDVTTYGALARQAGRPAAARAVGTVMNRNPIPIVLPCHRVIGSTGKLVGYGGGLARKEALLRLEGVIA
jgi:methylated-DNA-[protein]-cysteine S-methyltransferase